MGIFAKTKSSDMKTTDNTDLICETDDVVGNPRFVEPEYEQEDETSDLIDTIDEDEQTFVNMSQELDRVFATMSVIQQYGTDKSSTAVLTKSNLLTGISLEAYVDSVIPSEIALEALGANGKEKAAKYSAKILETFKATGAKILESLRPIFTSITETVKELSHKAWTNTKAVVKAHPLKTVMAGLAVLGSIVGVLTYVGKNVPTTGDLSKTQSFAKSVYDLMSKIEFPDVHMPKVSGDEEKLFKQFSANKTTSAINGSADRGIKGTDGIFKGATQGNPKDMGWTQAAVSTVAQKVSRLWVELKDGIGALGINGIKLSRSVWGTFEHTLRVTVPDAVTHVTGSREAGNAAAFATGGIIFMVVMRAVWAVWRLVTKTFSKVLKAIGRTFKSLVSFT